MPKPDGFDRLSRAVASIRNAHFDARACAFQCYDAAVIVLRLTSSLAVASLLVLSVFTACTDPDEPEASPIDAAADGGCSTPLIDAQPYRDAHGGNPQPSPPTGPSPFGESCESDAGCAPGLHCLTSTSHDWLGGGPAHGYCSLDCTDDSSVCSVLDATASCLTSTARVGRSYCMKGCVLGDTSGTDKCNDRTDVSCSLVDFFPSCMPNCGGDEDCPADRYCDQKHGVCADGVRTGDAAGVQCDPEGPNTCDAYCADLGNGDGACTGLCTLGAPYACNVPADASDVVGLPLCVSYTGDRPGDAGICVKRCRCNDDCDHPSAYCDVDHPEAKDGIGLCAFDSIADAGTRGVLCAPLADASVPDAEL